MENMKLQLKIQTSQGFYKMSDLSGKSSIKELKTAIFKITNINEEKIKILTGYPPRCLKEDDNITLNECEIKTGETIIVEIANNNLDKPEKKIKLFKKEPINILKYPPSTQKEFSVQEEICLICDDGKMLRFIVPSDNSCLFSAIYFITHNKEIDQKKSNNLRKIIADAIGNNKEKYTTAYLGRENSDYCQWIMNSNSWGGAIELSIFSEYFKIEIVCIDIKSGAIIKFGQDKFSLRGILVYDGIHYDPLILECEHLKRKLFPSKEQCFINKALLIVKEAQSQRQFTDVENFNLKCEACSQQLKGEEEAKAHAAVTGHQQFGEI